MASGRFLRGLGCILAGGLVFAAAGCGVSDRYSPDLSYGVRTDFLQRETLTEVPAHFNPPGHFPFDFLQNLPMRFDPTEMKRFLDYGKIDRMLKDRSLRLDDNQKAILKENKEKNKLLNPLNLTVVERARLGDLLNRLFGTPASPIVKEKAAADAPGVARETIETLKLDPDTLAEGSRLYRHHCLHCHGLEGNGRGPTGYWVNPHPRDYRQGVFKFTSSTQDEGTRKPNREDLIHIVQNGIEGTSMPSFGMYPREELEKIVSYVIHLSMRGQVEYMTMKNWLTDPSQWLDESTKPLFTPPTAEEKESLRAGMLAEGKSAQEITDALKKIDELKTPDMDAERRALKALETAALEQLTYIEQWWVEAQSEQFKIKPLPYTVTNDEQLVESAARGAKIFAGGACATCHKNYGTESPHAFDTWGTIVRGRNFTDGYLRGGRRPIDVYYRIHSGIAGVGMGKQDPNDVWDLVNFVQALHYPELRKQLREKFGVSVD